MEKTNLSHPTLSALLLGIGIAAAIIGSSVGIWAIACRFLWQLLL